MATIAIFFPQRRRDRSWIADAIRSRKREYIVSVLERARMLACGHQEIWQYRPRRRTSACFKGRARSEGWYKDAAPHAQVPSSQVDNPMKLSC